MVVWYIELECNGFTSVSLCDHNFWPSVINVLSKRPFNVRLSIQYCLHKLNNNLKNQKSKNNSLDFNHLTNTNA